MLRRVAFVALALLAAGLVYAAAAKEVTGTVKSVTGGTFVVTDSAAKDWTFTVDSKLTKIIGKGMGTKGEKLKEEGKAAVASEFLAEKDKVVVKYVEKDGKMTATEVHIRK